VHDIDFDMKALTVRSGKGDKDRVTTFPPSLQAPLEAHLVRVKIVHEGDIANGYGEVYLPHALARKYPNAACL
jgi:site-specific recombinase XerD